MGTIETCLLDRRRHVWMRRALLGLLPDLDETVVTASLRGAKSMGDVLENLLRVTGQQAAFMLEMRALLEVKLEDDGGEDHLQQARSLRAMDGLENGAQKGAQPPVTGLCLVSARTRPRRSKTGAKPKLKTVSGREASSSSQRPQEQSD